MDSFVFGIEPIPIEVRRWFRKIQTTYDSVMIIGHLNENFEVMNIEYKPWVRGFGEQNKEIPAWLKEKIVELVEQNPFVKK